MFNREGSIREIFGLSHLKIFTKLFKTRYGQRPGVVVVRPGYLYGDGAEGSLSVSGTQDILLSEAVPLDRRQESHRGDTRLLKGVVTLGGDGEPACCTQRLPVTNRKNT